MSEPIKLKVPEKGVERSFSTYDPEQKKQVEEMRAVEYVSQGNYEAHLEPNSTIEVKDRRFADWLISEYGLTEIVEKSESSEDDDQATEFEAQYPSEFPKRKVFIGLQIPYETARNLSHEQLTAISGIKDKTAGEILAWIAAQPASEPQTTTGAITTEGDGENQNDGGEN